ncbi:unnamed protein product [Arctia plantaginis]|uniref:Thioredoxin-like fold domain-containing protein n=1 Tax=Arctia plantaginis TaxID=874455 RepID=A0A8S0Z9Q9_ARCPL|nr:unnamed protein product [Arctia plantaginis]
MSNDQDEESSPGKEIIHKLKILNEATSPYNWLQDANVYNKQFFQVPYEWFVNNSDIIIAFFTAKGIDFKGMISKFYETYENAKLVNLPIEVIYIPVDETEDDFKQSYEEQANWFTLKFNDKLIPLLIFMYGISSLPHLMVTRVDGTIISHCGLLDLEEYGRNVLISWLTASSSNKTHRRLSKETMYGPVWRYLTSNGPTNERGPEYRRKFSTQINNLPPPLESEES